MEERWVWESRCSDRGEGLCWSGGYQAVFREPRRKECGDGAPLAEKWTADLCSERGPQRADRSLALPAAGWTLAQKAVRLGARSRDPSCGVEEGMKRDL
ncbi:hypothetical protein NDU88_003914 [Pleurodeles waltl]|uniref:Uncharacterized protein n=1 Tax=Pleurodeles waltl TaxID=8319 RepID=A0AAV7M8H6_PLEWA|nr:hypothetical protein NDU88_003914 [Pleurodeles waltl]